MKVQSEVWIPPTYPDVDFLLFQTEEHAQCWWKDLLTYLAGTTLVRSNVTVAAMSESH